tara:strand:- start:1047 stop:1778 length:732 start_codon:yes stop_codon:yes gene_type:complete
MNNIALLISTYDDSEDLWRPLEQTYLRYWNNINFPIYLTTNHKVFESNLFESLMIGDELSWSDNLIKSLNKIQQNYVLLTFDDLFLTSQVDHVLLLSLINRAIHEEFNYFQLYRSISKGRRLDNLIFKKLNQTKYKNSTIWSLWKKDVLLNLLEEKENAWEFEIKGNIRSFKYDNFYSTRKNVIPFINGIVKGVWNPLAKNKLKNLGFSICEDRGMLGPLDTLNYKIRDLQFDFLTSMIHKIY